jgi:hypothetical protein
MKLTPTTESERAEFRALPPNPKKVLKLTGTLEGCPGTWEVFVFANPDDTPRAGRPNGYLVGSARRIT